MPTYIPTKAFEGTRAERLLGSVAIVLALIFLSEMTIKTPQASEMPVLVAVHRI